MRCSLPIAPNARGATIGLFSCMAFKSCSTFALSTSWSFTSCDSFTPQRLPVTTFCFFVPARPRNSDTNSRTLLSLPLLIRAAIKDLSVSALYQWAAVGLLGCHLVHFLSGVPQVLPFNEKT